MHTIIRTAAIVSLATWTGVFASGCSSNKDASTRALRSQANGLRGELQQAQDALRAAQQERDELVTANQALTDKVAQLEKFNREESARLDALHKADAASAAGRIRDLSDEAHALRREIERRETEKQRLQNTIEEQTHSIGSLNVSLDAERKTVARLESEKTALAEALQDTRHSKAKMTMIMGFLLVGSVITTYVARGRKRQESREPEATPRFHTGALR